MASLKALRKRISSVKSTQQITKAMKMVSAAKLRRAQHAATHARPYVDKLSELLRAMAARVDKGVSPLLEVREREQHIDLILVTGDRGLCGVYNTNLIRLAQRFMEERQREFVRLTAIGSKGLGFFRKRAVDIVEDHTGMRHGPDHALAVHIGNRVARDYAAGEVDAVYLIYSRFQSTLSQVPTLERLLPVTPEEGADESLVEYIYEPDPATLLDRLLLQYITALIDHAFLESIASEHAARMAAMDSATSNASEMIDSLTLGMNRARQAAITSELMEIVSGAEALKG